MEERYASLLFELSSMLTAYSSFSCISCASIDAALFLRQFFPMPNAYSSTLDLVGTSFMATWLALCPMPFAHSSFYNCLVGAFIAATQFLCPMPSAHSSLLSLICDSISAASFALRSMLDAHSSFFGILLLWRDLYILLSCIVRVLPRASSTILHSEPGLCTLHCCIV